MLAAGYLHELLVKMGVSESGARSAEVLIGKPLGILLILAGGLVVSRYGARLARRSVLSLTTKGPVKESVPARAEARGKTLAGVAASVVRIVVWTLALLMALEQVGLNLGPLLAGASIVGVALGFGAQSLVRDFLSGFFILAEDQYGVADLITVNDVTGTVEEISLRVTRLRAADGTVWFVPNGEIRKVGNSAREWSRAIVDIALPPGADVGAATAAIAEELRALDGDPDWDGAVLESPEVLGVEALGSEGTTVRVSVKTNPDHRAQVARELRGRIAGRLRQEGIVATPTAVPNPSAGSSPGSNPGSP